MRRAVRAVAGAFLLALMPAGFAHAADIVTLPPLLPAPPPPTATSSRWTIEIGAEMRALPRYQGSDRYEFFPFPLFDLRDAGTPPRFHGPRDGFGYALLDTPAFKAGPVIQVELGREVKHNPALAGLGDVGPTAEVGAFVDYWPTSWLRARVEVRQGFGGHAGVVADQFLDVIVPVTPQWTLSGGPRLTEATREANFPYFGIDAGQSAASGLPVYDPGGGLRSVGVGAQARYQWNAQWESHAFVEYSRLSDGIAGSPVVAVRGSPDQAMFGIGSTYTFDMPALW
jgi:MipA family protein